MVAPITGEYPNEHNTPSLTVPFNKTAKGAPIVKANLSDKDHPINIANVSGKTRGAAILLDDNTIHVALGHKSTDQWKELGAGGGGGGDGTVKSVNGVAPDGDGNVTIAVGKGTVTSVNGVEPDAQGALRLNVVTQVNGAGPDVTGNINVPIKLTMEYFGDATLTINDTSDGKYYVLNGTGQSVTFGKITKSIQLAIVGTDAWRITQGSATQFICEGVWSDEIPAGRSAKLLNNGGLWILDRPITPAAP